MEFSLIKKKRKKEKIEMKQQMREKREKKIEKKALHFTQPANLFEMTQQPTTTKTIIRKKTN